MSREQSSFSSFLSCTLLLNGHSSHLWKSIRRMQTLKGIFIIIVAAVSFIQYSFSQTFDGKSQNYYYCQTREIIIAFFCLYSLLLSKMYIFCVAWINFDFLRLSVEKKKEIIFLGEKRRRIRSCLINFVIQKVMWKEFCESF